MADSGFFRNIIQKMATHPKQKNSPIDPELEEIRRSGFFDADWYLKEYPDIQSSGTDPLAHFVKHGWRELRDPSPLFDTKWYLEAYLDSRIDGLNPLLHYIRFGLDDGLSCQDTRSKDHTSRQEFCLPPTCLDFISANSVEELIERALNSTKHSDPFIAYDLIMKA